MPRMNVLMATLATVGLSSMAYADGNVDAGHQKAAQCAGCHGAKGEGNGTNPRLAGKSKEELAKAIGAFKSGARTNATMKMFTAKLTAQDIDDLAAYYASLKSK